MNTFIHINRPATPCCGAHPVCGSDCLGAREYLCRECGTETCTACCGRHEDAGPDSWAVCRSCSHRTKIVTTITWGSGARLYSFKCSCGHVGPRHKTSQQVCVDITKHLSRR